MANTAHQLSQNILAHVSREALPEGSPLSVSKLAKLCSVSRTPVVNALQELVERGIAEHRRNRGYFLTCDARDAEAQFGKRAPPSRDYVALTKYAQDVGDNGTTSAADLVAKLGVTRARALTLLDRGGAEGWLRKSAGHNWIISLGITSEADYRRLYRFRETIEPAALSEPDYSPDMAELDRLRAIQARLMAGAYRTIAAVDLFEINRELHETIVSWSGNRFYLDALKRSNDLRRLIEYSKVLETHKIDGFAAEHINILDTIAEGDMKRARALVLQHLQGARAAKT
ncbi:FCD domain-containing protein [Rhodobacteraceae bacterium]|nr:FCD domain-containing protein [Paracoccaceae bacterium]